jgi:hypothetical protein
MTLADLSGAEEFFPIFHNKIGWVTYTTFSVLPFLMQALAPLTRH